MQRKRIGFLGGSFNPPHIAHLINAEQARQALDLEKVYFMPSANPPHKSVHKKLIDGQHRLEMVKKAIADNPYFDIESYEVDRGGKHYTFNTMTALKEKYPDTDFYFIIGGDMIEDLPNWYRIDELLKIVQFVGINRPGFDSASSYPVLTVESPDLDISSSDIRQRIKAGKTIRYFVPDAVMDYIEKEGLYHVE